jgi:hypothetical protein
MRLRVGAAGREFGVQVSGLEVVCAIRQRVRSALDDGAPMRVKLILQELTEEVPHRRP